MSKNKAVLTIDGHKIEINPPVSNLQNAIAIPPSFTGELELLPHQAEQWKKWMADARRRATHSHLLDPVAFYLSKIDHAARVAIASKMSCQAQRLQFENTFVWVDELRLNRQLAVQVAVVMDEAEFTFSGPLAAEVMGMLK